MSCLCCDNGVLRRYSTYAITASVDGVDLDNVTGGSITFTCGGAVVFQMGFESLERDVANDVLFWNISSEQTALFEAGSVVKCMVELTDGTDQGGSTMLFEVEDGMPVEVIDE